MPVRLMSRGPALGILPMMMTACSAPERTFGEDVAFLREHTRVVVLGDEVAGPAVAVVPAWQGRVVTSSARGESGIGHGWINYELIERAEIQDHINVYGGEDRFWIGPEAGQFSVFFTKGDPFELEHWQTPAVIDTMPYSITGQTGDTVSFRCEAELTNYAGTTFRFRIDRAVNLLSADAIEEHLGTGIGGAEVVAFESVNSITNTGPRRWTKDRGLLSIWILGMFKPSDGTTVVIPFRTGPDAERGPVVNDAYFGKVPPQRLRVDKGVLFFRGDGRHRSKIGLSPRRAWPRLGSFDPARGVLTVVQYNQPPPEVTDYVNSMWELQDEPYGGDAVNSYNDGPLTPGGGPLGPIYELETSSPALELEPGESVTHVHRTFHFLGRPEELNRLALAVLGVSLDRIRRALR